MNDKVQNLNRTWRPVLMWGLVFLVFALIIENRVMAWMQPENPTMTFSIQIITIVLTALVGNSIIRQTGKHTTLMANKEIKMAMMENNQSEDFHEEDKDLGFDDISAQLDIDKVK